MTSINIFNKEFDSQKIELTSNQTTFFLDLKFQKDGKTFHLVEQEIMPKWDEDESDDNQSDVYYRLANFRTDSINLAPTEITILLINYLGHLKLYLQKYEIVREEVFVSYKSPESESDSFMDLKYCPKSQNRNIYLDVECQLEDGVNYEEFLSIRVKEPLHEISDTKLKELNYGPIDDSGIRDFVILSDEDAKKYIA